MPILIRFALGLGLTTSPVLVHLDHLPPVRRVLPVTVPMSRNAGDAARTCTIEVTPVEAGVTFRVRTSPSAELGPGYDQSFSVPTAELPLTNEWSQSHDGMSLEDEFTYDGSAVRIELRSREAPAHALVYRIEVDPDLRIVTGVRITEFDGAEPASAPVRSVLECEAALN